MIEEEKEEKTHSFERTPSEPLEPLRSNWRPSKEFRRMSIQDAHQIRAENRILAEGKDLMAPIKSFKDMRFPKAFRKALEEKGIWEAKGIQIQCLPAVLLGRDLIALAPSGSGKTLIFLIQAIVLALEEEKTLSTVKGEGPFCLIVVPLQELAIQIYDNLVLLLKYLNKEGYPKIKATTCIGGVDIGPQIDALQEGVHIVIGTPGRLSDLLHKRRLNLEFCELLVLDEADRLLDETFAEETYYLFSKLGKQRQIILSSSTLSNKIYDVAKKQLNHPIVVTSSEKRVISTKIIQEVEYIKPENRLNHLLETLNKTPPPVLIFSENKNDIDEIYEFLLLKGVDAAGLHGGKTREERSEAIKEFLDGKKDVLISTDFAVKGLEMPDIKHVINFSLPRDISLYVDRLKKLGRKSSSGLATTFISKSYDVSILLDLKELLLEYEQPIPPFIQVLKDPEREKISCTYCGSVRHNMKHCIKYEKKRLRTLVGLETNTEK